MKLAQAFKKAMAVWRENYALGAMFGRLAVNAHRDTVKLMRLTGITKEELQHYVMQGWSVKDLISFYAFFKRLPKV